MVKQHFSQIFILSLLHALSGSVTLSMLFCMCVPTSYVVIVSNKFWTRNMTSERSPHISTSWQDIGKYKTPFPISNPKYCDVKRAWKALSTCINCTRNCVTRGSEFMSEELYETTIQILSVWFTLQNCLIYGLTPLPIKKSGGVALLWNPL